MKIILASGSPRRKSLLESLNIDCTVLVPGIDERQEVGEAPEAYVRRNALSKARAVFDLGQSPKDNPLILSADTIVVLGGKVLEKPANISEARTMLHSMKGRSHVVLTAFCLKDARREYLELVSTTVTFKDLTDAEIDAYVATAEPYDKAGAYGAQGTAAYMVHRVEGSYTNVVGLPMSELTTALRREFGMATEVRADGAF